MYHSSCANIILNQQIIRQTTQFNTIAIRLRRKIPIRTSSSMLFETILFCRLPRRRWRGETSFRNLSSTMKLFRSYFKQKCIKIQLWNVEKPEFPWKISIELEECSFSLWNTIPLLSCIPYSPKSDKILKTRTASSLAFRRLFSPKKSSASTRWRQI